MALAIRCPKCSTQHQVQDDMRGKTAKCNCGALLKIPAAAGASAGGPAAAGAGSSSVQCPGCNQQHPSNPALAGQMVQCGCGATFQMPGAAAAADPFGMPGPGPSADPFGAPAAHAAAGNPMGAGMADDPWGDLAMAERSAPAAMNAPPPPSAVQDNPFADLPNPQQSADDRALAAQLGDPNWSRRKETPSQSRSFEGSVFNGGVMGGMLAMLAAVVWFVAGLFGGIIFFYPPVLFIIGLAAVIRGVLSND